MADPTQTQRATESPAENGTPERPHPLQAAFNAAIADPDNVALQLAYARAAESAGKYEAAFPVYERVLALDPNNREAKTNAKLIEDIYRSMGRPIPK